MLILGAAANLLLASLTHMVAATNDVVEGSVQLKPYESISVHDPVMIRQNGTYYVFATGHGINVWRSSDMKHWTKQAPVFATPPTWIKDVVPSFRGDYWAPDISFHQGKYYLYYAVSAFGKNTSAIGVATSSTLDTNDVHFKWEDQGMVIQSIPGQDNWNAIDPNLIVDDAGTPYLVFGSFWGGLEMGKLTPDYLKFAGGTSNLVTVASRKASPSDPNPPAPEGNPPDAGGNAIEAPFIYKHGQWYYLFASIDYCCRGAKSNYKVIVGRSKNVTGPFLDEQGKDLARGGGTVIVAGDSHWYGVGHTGTYQFDGVDYLIFHGYDAAQRAIPKLCIEKITWTPEGWLKVSASRNE